MLDETNVGLVDRAFRVLLGLAILVLAQVLAVSIFMQALMIVIGSVVMVTGFVGFCLLYQIFGIRTSRAKF